MLCTKGELIPTYIPQANDFTRKMVKHFNQANARSRCAQTKSREILLERMDKLFSIGSTLG